MRCLRAYAHVRRAASPDRHVARHRDRTVAQHGLEQILVHRQRRGCHARPDVGDARELQHPLDAPVLAERPVQDGEHDVHRRARAVRCDEFSRTGPLVERDLGPIADLREATLGERRRRDRHLVLDGRLPASPADELKAPRAWKTLPRYLSVPEVDLLLAQPDVSTPRGLRDRALIELLYATGMRVSELVGIRPPDVNLDASFLTCTGKGDKQRIVPIGDEAARWVRDYVVQSRPRLLKGRTSPRLFVNALVQYNTDTHQWSTNARFNVIHRPLSDFFFVYNERRLDTSGDLVDRSIIAKLTWLMAF